MVFRIHRISSNFIQSLIVHYNCLQKVIAINNSRSLEFTGDGMVLEVGSKAPDFEGKSDRGINIKLYDLLKSSEVVLYFYPKDSTPGCTAEACSFRDNWEDITKTGATVIGVSTDSLESHKKFRDHYSLPFDLISDPEYRIGKMFGLRGLLIKPRVTFVIDRNGIIRHVYESQLNARNHVKEALSALKMIRGNENAGSS
jgi:peroxiredoxin Q/BCP